MNESATILAIGDIHLGTACSGLPDDLPSLGIDPAELGPAAALKEAVDVAIREQVAAVLLAGDVVESTNARFEAILPLEDSLRRLADAGIEVIAVAGNHDVEALPRLAALTGGLTLLGKGGRWQARTVASQGTPLAQVIGWSFTERFERQSPVPRLLAGPPEPAPGAVPRIGLLHADLDASGGHYAPVRRAELEDAGLDAWLLGHVHKPSIDALAGAGARRPIGYLGSLVGLDPSESGPHGPWLLRIAAGGGVEMAMLPLAPLRWEHLSLAVDGLEHAEDLPDRLLAEAGNVVRRLHEAGGTPQVIGLRVRLRGTCPAHVEIRKRVAVGDWINLARKIDGVVVFVNKIQDAMELHLDLAEIARGDDPPGLLARRIAALEAGGAAAAAVLAAVRDDLNGIAEDERWRPAADHRNAVDPLSDAALREMLLRLGKAALSAMLSDAAASDRT